MQTEDACFIWRIQNYWYTSPFFSKKHLPFGVYRWNRLVFFVVYTWDICVCLVWRVHMEDTSWGEMNEKERRMNGGGRRGGGGN